MRFRTIVALKCYLCRTRSPSNEVLLGKVYGLLNLWGWRWRRRTGDGKGNYRKVALELSLLHRLLVTNIRQSPSFHLLSALPYRSVHVLG
jgi:hypothetical protein